MKKPILVAVLFTISLLLVSVLVAFLLVDNVNAALPFRPTGAITAPRTTATYDSYFGELKTDNQYITLAGLETYAKLPAVLGQAVNFSYGDNELVANLGANGKYHALVAGSISAYSSATYQVAVMKNGTVACETAVKLSANEIKPFPVSCVLTITAGDLISVSVKSSTGIVNPTVSSNLVLKRI